MLSPLKYFLELNVADLQAEIERKLDDVEALQVEIKVLEGALAFAKSIQAMGRPKEPAPVQKPERRLRGIHPTCPKAIMNYLRAGNSGDAEQIAAVVPFAVTTVRCVLSKLSNDGLVESEENASGVYVWKLKGSQPEAI